MNGRTKRLVDLFGGRIMKYRDMPRPARLAIAHYMAIDGEAWALPDYTERWPVFRLKKELDMMLPHFVAEHGNERFGYVKIPMKALVESILQDPWVRKTTYGTYETLLKSGWEKTKHPTTNRWPVILSGNDDETLQDGWHRLSAYYWQRARVVPAVYYP